MKTLPAPTGKTISLKPSPEGYKQLLRVVAENSTVREDRIWAKEELAKINQ
jgi:hypothetical protein